jgi:hypothetical protein
VDVPKHPLSYALVLVVKETVGLELEVAACPFAALFQMHPAFKAKEITVHFLETPNMAAQSHPKHVYTERDTQTDTRTDTAE